MVLRKERQTPFGAAAPEHSVPGSIAGAMNNEQPVTKRQRIDGLHLANGDHINGSDSQEAGGEGSHPKHINGNGSDRDELDNVRPPQHGLLISDFCPPPLPSSGLPNSFKSCHPDHVNSKSSSIFPPASVTFDPSDVWLPLSDGLLKQCLCPCSTDDLQRPFRLHYARLHAATAAAAAAENGHQIPSLQPSHPPPPLPPLCEWPAAQLIAFLSQLQLLFDIYLKQSRCGRLCRAIGAALAVAEHRSSAPLVDEIISLAGYSDRFVQFLAARVLCTFLVFQEREQSLNEWLRKLVDNMFVVDVPANSSMSTQRVAFSLEIFRRILEWNDVDLHPLDEDENERDGEDDVGYDDDEEDDDDEDDEDEDEDGGRPARRRRRGRRHEEDEELDEEEEEEDLDDEDEELDSEDGEMAALMARSNARMQQQQQQGVPRPLPPIETNYFNFYSSAYGEHQSVSAAAASTSTSSAFGPSTSSSMPAPSSSSSMPGPSSSSHHHPTIHQSPATSSSVSITSSSVTSSRGDLDDRDICVENDDDDDSNDRLHSNLLPTNHPRHAEQNPPNPNGCTYLEMSAIARHDDTGALKCCTVRNIATRWPALLVKMNAYMSALMAEHRTRTATSPTTRLSATESVLHTFLELWRAIIAGSAKNAFLTVNDTQPFYEQLDEFETAHVRRQLPPTVYKQVLQLFNAVLCYGDALATETAISNETCNLAYRIIRHLQGDLLQSMPLLADCENPVSLIGFAGRSTVDTMVDTKRRRAMGLAEDLVPIGSSGSASASGSVDMDKTYLQNMVLLVLKSVAVSVRDMRSDSSDSSIESTNQRQEAHSEFRNIAKDMRPLLEKLNVFAKERLQLHPRLHFSRMLVALFIEQDDFLIEAMVCTLDVANNFQFGGQAGDAAFDELIALVNPVYTFLEFLEQTQRNWELLLNYLISIETCFLLYFLRFIKYIATHWGQFEAGCREWGEMYGQRDVCEQTMRLLGELRKEIGGMVAEDRFPYDIWPVLKLMDKCLAAWDCPL